MAVGLHAVEPGGKGKGQAAPCSTARAVARGLGFPLGGGIEWNAEHRVGGGGGADESETQEHRATGPVSWERRDSALWVLLPGAWCSLPTGLAHGLSGAWRDFWDLCPAACVSKCCYLIHMLCAIIYIACYMQESVWMHGVSHPPMPLVLP
jgi:hypothetical protein